MTTAPRKIELRVPAAVGRLLQADAPRELRLAVARGTLPLAPKDLAVALLLFIRGKDAELRTAAEETLRTLPPFVLLPVVRDANTHPQVLDVIARYRPRHVEILEPLLVNPAVADETLVALARQAQGTVLQLLSHNDRRLLACLPLREALLANPALDGATRFRLSGVWGTQEVAAPAADVAPAETEEVEAEPAAEPEGPEEATADEAPAAPASAEEEAEAARLLAEAEAQLAAGELVPQEDSLDAATKYQLLQTMPVAEKIKMALTGDREWRSLLLKEPNRMVSSGVLKNPRITDPEVYTVVQNKASNEELIRLILLNRDWTSNGEIRKALVTHPRTPAQKAIRFMEYLSEKDLKLLAKSRSVAQPIVNNARRLLQAKEHRR